MYPDMYFVSRMLPEHSRTFLEAHRMIPERFRENSKFHENLDFSESCPDLCLLVTFSKTHRRTCHLHSWIALYLRKVEKLVRSETNTQILRYLHFSDPFTPIFDSPVESKLGARGKPSTIVYRAGWLVEPSRIQHICFQHKWNFSNFCVMKKNLSRCTTFSKTHRQTCSARSTVNHDARASDS